MCNTLLFDFECALAHADQETPFDLRVAFAQSCAVQ
jgi:hypothetical protein